ncbi:related to nucleoporin [Rhynchosporium secalis]|uniref:Related to nucleoporin n=1 Tax=Rhynchosporium secalis TaxID=38038 RepID=A0A1E1ME01_RHYSE|nr:related to nucleoporin [Rhynchosporium secalis]
MAFSFGGPAASAPTGGANVQNGPDLEDIQTEALGFRALSGEAKIQLLPTPWPANQLPPPTSSLMSIASQRGLLAAAGPDAIIVASTESVRKAFEGAGGNIKQFQPQLNMPMPMRVSQVAFSADETYLVLSAETGGGLAVYEVQSLLRGSTEPAYQLPTENLALRALVPNPTPEKAELFALVTTDGKLMMANLKERTFVSGSNGAVLKTGVSCVSWSARGKQLVAGLGDGTAYQMTPEGEGKAEIPRPPNVNAEDHVSSITWLENLVFLMVHTPSSFDNNQAPNSTFHLVTRQMPTNFTFQKISDPAGPFGLNRSPPHHFMLRLRDFPPNLQDLIVVASSASADIGLFSRSKVPLTTNKPADKVAGVFTMTEMSDDSHRAALPMNSNFSDTSPIGLAMDLSSNKKVEKPIPGDEMDESPYPVPALMVLNNEGILAAWWVIYMDSIRQGTAYPGLVAVGGSQTTPKASAPAAGPSTALNTASQSAFGSSAFAPSSTSAFGATRPATSFGTTSASGPATGAFGATSGLGKSQSPWATAGTSAASNTPAFGASAFGSTKSTSNQAFGAPSFGATSTPALGNRASPWGSAASAGTTAAFGQTGGLGKPASVFGHSTSSGSTPAASGFASFASNQGGFAAAAGAKPTGSSSLFSSQPAASANSFASAATNQTAATPSVFGTQPAQTANPFSTPSTGSAWGSSTVTQTPNPLAAGGFKLSSSFKADPLAKDDSPEPAAGSKGGLFGRNFSSALGEASKSLPAAQPVSKEADMDSDDVPVKEKSSPFSSMTPASTPAAPKTSLFGSTTPANGGIFGTTPATQSAASKTLPAGFGFGKPSEDKPKPAAFSFANLGTSNPPGPKTPLPSDSPLPPVLPETPLSPKVKPEPFNKPSGISTKIPEAPLPPDTTSKSSYAAGESSGSSIADAPLPPDFMPKASLKPSQPLSAPSPVAQSKSEESIPTSDLPGGPDDDGDDSGFLTEEGGDESEAASEDVSEERSEEGSGEDVAQQLSPESETNETLAISPESSFGGLKNRSPESSMFTKISIPGPQKPALFGELNNSAPVLLPPKVQLSPRSPSPVRNAIPGRLRPEPLRSSSAPGFASQILGSQRGSRPTGPVQPTLAQTQAELQNEEKRRQETRAKQEAEEKQALVDEEDDRFHDFMSSELEPLRTLPNFEIHTDYQSQSSSDSIPAQVEAVYRDINSMIDTLGINARAMQCFIKGHTEQYKDEGRTREDLEEDDEWCLVEVENLSSIVEKDLAQELAKGRVKDIQSRLQSCETLQKELTRLRAKHEDVKKMIDSYRDPESLALARAQPLHAEQAAQQTDLRNDFAKFQKLLSEAEEALTILKAKIVSQETSNHRSGGSSQPTVEAVMRTITKMTTMAEKRSGDIDVLEGQMRRLRFGSVDSREGSPFATPQKNRASIRNPGASSTYGLFHTPDSRESSQRLQNSLMSSIGSRGYGSPDRKKLSGYTAQEKTQLRAQLAKKQEVTERLKRALKKNGTKARLMDDDE